MLRNYAFKSYRSGACNCFCVLIFIVFISGCKANHKSSDEVEHIFSVPALTLNQKMAQLCAQLTNATSGPRLDNISFAQQACTTAGDRAQIIKPNESFYFTNITSDGEKLSSNNPNSKGDERLLWLKTRAQVWLNRSIISVAGSALELVNKGVTSNQNEKMTIKKLSETKFDKSKISFELTAQLISTVEQNGNININNKVQILGQKLNDSFVVSIKTIEPASVESSLFKDMRIFAFVILHANDVYLDLLFDVDVHSFGVDAIMKERILDSFADAIDDMIKKLLKVRS